MGSVPLYTEFKPIRIVRVLWYGRVLCGMTISVLISVNMGVCVGVFGNKNNATGAGSSVVVEWENVLLLSWGKPSKYCLSLKKKSDFNSTT